MEVKIMISKVRLLRDIAEALPTGLEDRQANEKMLKEATEIGQAIKGGDPLGVIMECADVAYYAVKAFYNCTIHHNDLSPIIGLMAGVAGVEPEVLLDCAIEKMSLRTDGTKNDDAERAAVTRVLKGAKDVQEKSII